MLVCMGLDGLGVEEVGCLDLGMEEVGVERW